MKQLYVIMLGLGRLANHHQKTFYIAALSQDEAVGLARSKYYAEIDRELGQGAPILGKVLTVVFVGLADKSYTLAS